MIHKRPRDRQHGDINPDPPATAQLRHAIIWKPYGLVPFFGYSTPKACLGLRRTSLTTKQNKTKSHAITKKLHTPTLICLSTPESTAIYGVPSTRNQAQKNESYEETPTCVLQHRNLSVQSPLRGWQNINPLSYLLSLLRQNGLVGAAKAGS